jgi:hypothetical protein
MAEKVLFQTALTDIKSSDVEGIGALRNDVSGNVYRWVYNIGASAMAAGGCAFVHDSAGSLSTALTTVDRATASSLGMDGLAGIAMAAITSSAGASPYGWIQCRGFHSGVSVVATSTYGPGCSLKGVAGSTAMVLDKTSASTATFTRTVITLNSASTASTQTTLPCYIHAL